MKYGNLMRSAVAAGLSLAMVLGTVPAQALEEIETQAEAIAAQGQVKEDAEAGAGAVGSGQTSADDALARRADEAADVFRGADNPLGSLWDALAAVEVADGAQDDAEAAIAALDGDRSTAAGVTKAFVAVASRLGFDAREVAVESGQPVARVSIDGASYDLDVVAGAPGERPWLAEVQGEPVAAQEGIDDAGGASTRAADDEEEPDEASVTGPEASEAEAVGDLEQSEREAEGAARAEAQAGARADAAATPPSASPAGQTKQGESTAKGGQTPSNEVVASKAASKNASEGVSAQMWSDSIGAATVAKIANQAYTGKAIKPSPKVTYYGRTLVKGTDYTLSYKNNTKAGTATVTITGKGGFVGTKKVTFKIVAPTVLYKVHRQTYGWESGWKKNGQQSGTTGESKRLEAIYVKLGANFPVSGGIRYKTHIQGIGWESSWKSNGKLSGTSGQSKRLEAIRIELTGNMKSKYDVYYRVHAQRLGWMGWAKNGANAGTAGYSYRLEAIQIRLVPKGAKAPGSTATPFKKQSAEQQAINKLSGWWHDMGGMKNNVPRSTYHIEGNKVTSYYYGNYSGEGTISASNVVRKPASWGYWGAGWYFKDLGRFLADNNPNALQSISENGRSYSGSSSMGRVSGRPW